MRRVTAPRHPEADPSIGLTEQTQERHGYPFGDCVRASYASLLDLPLEDVPHFDPRYDQRAEERAWLRKRGLDLVVVPVEHGPDGKLVGTLPTIPSDLYHLISGGSPRHKVHGHRVVARGGHVVWDPHPERTGVTHIRAYLFVVPRNPGRVVREALSRAE